jgi:hypothetical protein
MQEEEEEKQKEEKEQQHSFWIWFSVQHWYLESIAGRTWRRARLYSSERENLRLFFRKQRL